MKLRLFQIDAFTTDVFSGNPAAVCPLEAALDTKQMQAIALENNLSETAFFVPTADGYDLRWFTPTTEVDLCGHATLASAYVIFNYLDDQARRIRFSTRSGPLTVERQNGLLAMNFPVLRPGPCGSPPDELIRGLGLHPDAILSYGEEDNSGYYVAVFKSEDAVRGIDPDFSLLAELGGMIVLPTAPGGDADYVLRCFAPSFGIDEDPVTGSAHCVLTPYWADRLGRNTLDARQVSERGGQIECQLLDDRVSIRGNAVCYLEGTIEV